MCDLSPAPGESLREKPGPGAAGSQRGPGRPFTEQSPRPGRLVGWLPGGPGTGPGERAPSPAWSHQSGHRCGRWPGALSQDQRLLGHSSLPRPSSEGPSAPPNADVMPAEGLLRPRDPRPRLRAEGAADGGAPGGPGQLRPRAAQCPTLEDTLLEAEAGTRPQTWLHHLTRPPLPREEPPGLGLGARDPRSLCTESLLAMRQALPRATHHNSPEWEPREGGCVSQDGRRTGNLGAGVLEKVTQVLRASQFCGGTRRPRSSMPRRPRSRPPSASRGHCHDTHGSTTSQPQS